MKLRERSMGKFRAVFEKITNNVLYITLVMAVVVMIVVMKKEVNISVCGTTI